MAVVTKTTAFGRWNVEIHSVNRKFLDITIHLPRDYLMFDIDIRKMISSEIQRGQVTVKVSLSTRCSYPRVSQGSGRSTQVGKEIFPKYCRSA
jgi:uncharacterized protein YicC (UPF0701 family)